MFKRHQVASKDNTQLEHGTVRRAQAAMEVLIIIGVLVVGVIIFGTFYFGNIGERSRGASGSPGDMNNSDLESAYNKALDYDGVEQVTMSGGSSHNQEDVDIEPPPVDPPTVFFLNSLYLTSNPTVPFRDEDFNITISVDTSYETIDIYQLDITSDETGEFAPTTFCSFNGEYASTIYNLGTLTNDASEHVSGTFSFSCHIEDPAVQYNFKFYARPTGLSEPIVIGEITKYFALQNSEFISVWDTRYEGSGLSEYNEIILPVISTGTYDFDVDWGDGTITHIDNSDPEIPLYRYDQYIGYTGDAKHTYDVPGIYTVTITGTIDGFTFVRPDLMGGNPLDSIKLQEISQWGPLRLGSQGEYFRYAQNLVITATDLLDTSDVTDMSNMFVECISLTEVPRINEWDTSNVTNTSYMFSYVENFNQPLSFDTSNVTNMSGMFYHAHNFNSIIDFDTSNVTDMSSMFENAISFNQPLSFDTSNVTDMKFMFRSASAFNQPLSFDTSNVTDMKGMFLATASFNSLLLFDTSNVTDMSEIFSQSNFNQNIGSWDTSNVTNMGHMFSFNFNFNKPIDMWNTSNVTNMSHMFYNAKSFNQILATGQCIFEPRPGYCLFDTSNVTDMSYMFYGAESFNKALSELETGNVTDMSYMFSNATNFDKNISSWTVDDVTSWNGIFENCPIQTNNKPPKFR